MAYTISKKLRRLDRDTLLRVIRWAMPEPETAYLPRPELSEAELEVISAVQDAAGIEDFQPTVRESDRAIVLDIVGQIIADDLSRGPDAASARQRLMERKIIPFGSMPLHWNLDDPRMLDGLVTRSVVADVLRRPLFVDVVTGSEDRQKSRVTTVCAVGLIAPEGRRPIFVLVIAELEMGKLWVRHVYRLSSARADRTKPTSALEFFAEFLRQYGVPFRLGNQKRWALLAINEVVPHAPSSKSGERRVVEHNLDRTSGEVRFSTTLRETNLSVTDIQLCFGVDVGRLFADEELYLNPRPLPVRR